MKSAEITITTTAIHAPRLPRGLAGRHQPDLVVIDFGSGFVHRVSPMSIVVARGFLPPKPLHLDPGTTTMAARVTSALASIGIARLRHLPVFLPLQASMSTNEVEGWCEMIHGLGVEPIVVRRPNAAAAAMGVEVAGHTHLMMEMGDRLIELAVLVDGETILSRSIRYLDGGWRTAVECMLSMLASIDPDQEFEVRDQGVHAYGPEWEMGSHVTEMVGLRLANVSGDRFTVARGTQLLAGDILRWLPTS